MEKKIPLLLIDANRLLRESISSGLNRQTGLRVVAACSGGEAALRCLREAKPRVVLIDASLGNTDTLDLIESIRAAAPGVHVIVLRGAGRAFCAGYDLKETLRSFLAEDAGFLRRFRTEAQLALDPVDCLRERLSLPGFEGEGGRQHCDRTDCAPHL